VWIVDVRELTEAFVGLGIDDEFAGFVSQTLGERADESGMWLELAAALRRQGQYRAALLTYGAAERRFPMLPELPNNRGILLREAGDLEGALEAFTDALRLRPRYASALESQGEILEFLDRPAEAADAYARLLELEPDRATAWNNIGNTEKVQGRIPEARRCYERAIELDPDYVFALVNLGGLLYELGDRPGAVELLDRALALDATDEVALELRERVLAEGPVHGLGSPAWVPSMSLAELIEAGRLHDEIDRRREEGAIVPLLLKRAKELNDRHGFLAWDPEKLERDPGGDPGPGFPRLAPPTAQSPRLFLSYAWARDDPQYMEGAYESDLWMEAFAGTLFGRGYDIVYDRDPRNADKGLSDIHVLRRLYDCNFFVPVFTELYAGKIADDSPATSAVAAEWNLARELAERGYLTFVGMWRSGEPPPAPLDQDNTFDMREAAPWGRDDVFPAAAAGRRAVPGVPAPDRPPDPDDWPKP
jgi:tetratricopeptide (TPR) repeat protein